MPPQAPGQYEIHFTRLDGIDVWGRVSSTPLAPETGGGLGVVLTQIEDITILRAMQARFAYAATHDRLTGLANRSLMLDRLTAALTRSRCGSDRVAVFFCDLDNFKEINDTHGHAAGDQLLAEVGWRLELTAREQDTVGRFGGDEFVVIGCPAPSAAEAGSIATRLTQTVRQPCTRPRQRAGASGGWPARRAPPCSPTALISSPGTRSGSPRRTRSASSSSCRESMPRARTAPSSMC